MPSIEQIQRLLAAEPEDTFLLYALAQEQAKGGDLAAAITTYDRVLALDPGHGYAYFHKARAQEQSGDLAGAAATLNLGLQAARAAGDEKAAGEIAGYLAEFAD